MIKLEFSILGPEQYQNKGPCGDPDRKGRFVFARDALCDLLRRTVSETCSKVRPCRFAASLRPSPARSKKEFVLTSWVKGP